MAECGAQTVRMTLALDPPRLALSLGGAERQLTLSEATRLARAWARLVELGWREVEARHE